jgi:hypothetical protein
MSATSSALYDAVCVDLAMHADTTVHPWSSHKQVAVHALRNSIVKKFEEQDTVADRAGLAKFLAIEDRNKAFLFDYASLPEWVQLVLGEARDAMHRALAGISPQMGSGNCGPGSSAGVGQLDVYTKHFAGPLSGCTSGIYRAYYASLTRRQMEAEDIRRAIYPDLVLCKGSSLSCVPKDAHISRTICTEPSMEMWLQKRCERNLTRALLRFGIDLANQQEVNREWARQGSLGRGVSTIDLTSASDTVLPSIVKFLLPREWYTWLNAIRCKSTVLPDGTLHRFALFSSMGNATTFPLQTLIFSSLLEGVYRICGGRAPIAVNGDDIIVSTVQYDNLSFVLQACGFLVNHEKSFKLGPFRESCGGDYWNGHDVRAVYVKRLDCISDWYSALNRVRDWCKLHDIVLFETLKFLVAGIRHATSKIHKDSKLHAVPTWEAPGSGFRDPCFKGSRYRCLMPQPRKLDMSPFVRGLSEPGLILAFLRGDLDGVTTSITLRSVVVKYRRRMCTTFFHDGRACNADEFLSAVIWGYAKGH